MISLSQTLAYKSSISNNGVLLIFRSFLRCLFIPFVEALFYQV